MCQEKHKNACSADDFIRMIVLRGDALLLKNHVQPPSTFTFIWILSINEQVVLTFILLIFQQFRNFTHKRLHFLETDEF